MNYSQLTKLPKICFVTGIGTDVGKTYATGFIARALYQSGEKTITQKFVQTGNTDASEDIIKHREIMGIEMQPEDLDGTTAPIIFTYPASPDLAARIDGKEFDPEIPKRATQKLAKRYDRILIEGAGGLMVPLKADYLCFDYIKDNKLPVIVVTNGQLGSINHTLLTLELLVRDNVEIAAVVYNPYFDKDKVICDDTRKYLASWLSKHSSTTDLIMLEEH